jgi:hypothetical protein
MHRSFFTITPPPLRWRNAPVGQASAQGAGRQARQVLASKPVESPPEETIRIPAESQETRLYTRRAQASEQELQPMHRSILGVVKTFMKFLLNLRFDARREIVWELRTIQKHESLRTKRQQRLGRSRTGEFGNGRETVFHPAGDGRGFPRLP